jgi:hypothetical protein
MCVAHVSPGVGREYYPKNPVVRNMRYVVDRNREVVTEQLIHVISFIYFWINFIYLFVRKYFPDIPRQDGAPLD